MTRPQIDLVRPLTVDERAWLRRLGRAHAEPATAHVARATALPAVAEVAAYTDGADPGAMSP